MLDVVGFPYPLSLATDGLLLDKSTNQHTATFFLNGDIVHNLEKANRLFSFTVLEHLLLLSLICMIFWGKEVQESIHKKNFKF